jgi:hypothetical protein
MIRLQVRRSAAAHDREHRWHRPLARGKDGAREQDLHVLPHRSRKDRDEDANDTAKASGKESMAILSGRREHEFHCRSMVTQIPING